MNRSKYIRKWLIKISFIIITMILLLNWFEYYSFHSNVCVFKYFIPVLTNFSNLLVKSFILEGFKFTMLFLVISWRIKNEKISCQYVKAAHYRYLKRCKHVEQWKLKLVIHFDKPMGGPGSTRFQVNPIKKKHLTSFISG